MNVFKDDLTFVINKNDVDLYISKSWSGDCFTLETVPYEVETTFVIEKSVDKVESDMFSHFKKLLMKLFGCYVLESINNNGMTIDLENRIIKIISDSQSRDELIIQYLGNKIALTFRKDMLSHYPNNIMVLDKSGVLFGYYTIFAEFFEALMSEEERTLPEARV